MFKHQDEKGLTLIELLITISVLAVVSAIALPVINNVVTSSNSNAYNQTLKDAQAFLDRYGNSGVVLYDGLQTLSGYIDKDGDNSIDADEKIDTLTLDSKYAMSVTGSASIGGSYSNGGVTAVTITTSTGGSSATPSTPTAQTFSPANGDFGTVTAINGAGSASAGFYFSNPFSSSWTSASFYNTISAQTNWTITVVNSNTGGSFTYQAIVTEQGGSMSISPDWNSNLPWSDLSTHAPDSYYYVSSIQVTGPNSFTATIYS